MENIMQVNSLKLDCLRPLGKWRIMDLISLQEAHKDQYSYWHLHKMVSRFEKAKVIHSFKDPWTKRKVIYLEGLGRGLLGVEKAGAINQETLLHDLKVSQMAQGLLRGSVFTDVHLEHELSKKLFLSGELSPDAILNGIKNGKRFSMALELELTRKANERIISKAKHYLNASHINYVLYLFCSQNLFESYKKVFDEGLPDIWNSKLMLFVNKSLMSKSFDINCAVGVFDKQEVHFNEIF